MDTALGPGISCRWWDAICDTGMLEQCRGGGTLLKVVFKSSILSVPGDLVSHRVSLHSPFSGKKYNNRVPTAPRKQGKLPKNSLSEKTQGIWKCCQNTLNLVCSSCEFPDSEGKRYVYICREKFLDSSAKSVLCM